MKQYYRKKYIFFLIRTSLIPILTPWRYLEFMSLQFHGDLFLNRLIDGHVTDDWTKNDRSKNQRPSLDLNLLYFEIFSRRDSQFSDEILTDRGAKVNVSLECLHRSFVARVPYPQRFIVRDAHDVFATGMEDDAAYPVVVSLKREEANSGSDVPDANRFVSRSRCEERTFVSSLVIGSSSRVYRRPRAVRRPGNALHHVVVVPELKL